MSTTSPAPLTLTQVERDLIAPFPYTQIELKPGALTRNTSEPRCLAMPYADLRAYESRLDEAVGLENWSTTYQMTGRGVVCALTICGVTKSGIGDYPLHPDDENAATSAQAQAFKRACSAFGLGRYLYQLPDIWCAYDPERKRIVNPQRVAWELYKKAGLLTPDDLRTPPPVQQPVEASRGSGR